MSKKKGLIFTDWYVPGYKAGGPIRSCYNLSILLEKDVDIYVFTSNSDVDESQSYQDIERNKWKSLSNHSVFYASNEFLSLKNIHKTITEVNPDFIYLNNMFTPNFTLKPLWLVWRNKIKCKVILAPRGMLHEGALKYKALKKRIFINVMKASGVYHKINFHATDNQEKIDIQNKLSINKNQINVIPNCSIIPEEYEARKLSSTLKLVFISRVSEKKNLLYFLQRLQNIKSSIEFNIYGNIEDHNYWEKCQQVIKTLPSNIKTEFHGSIEHKEVNKTLKKHHFFVLPTFGENFGHSIFEAFATGTPVIISDQTPWRNLTKQRIGWDIPLSDEESYVNTINFAAEMDEKTYLTWSKSAWNFAKNYVEDSKLKQQYLNLFD